MFPKNSDIVAKLKQEHEADKTAQYKRAVGIISDRLKDLTLDCPSFTYREHLDEAVASQLASELTAAGYCATTMRSYEITASRTAVILEVCLNLDDSSTDTGTLTACREASGETHQDVDDFTNFVTRA